MKIFSIAAAAFTALMLAAGTAGAADAKKAKRFTTSVKRAMP